MSSLSRPSLPPQPRIVDAVVGGLELVAAHIEVILLPVLLDLWLWLGPHLSVQRLVSLMLAQMPPPTGQEPAEVQDIWQLGVEVWQQIGERFNLFAALRAFPVGVPSLMAGQQPTLVPWGAPLWVDVHPALVGVALLALVVAGWLLGGVYFTWLTGCFTGESVSWADWMHHLGHTLLLGVMWLSLLLALGMPALFCVSLLALISPAVAGFMLMLFAGVGLWLLFPMFFSLHGVFLRRQSAWRSLLDGLQLVRLLAARTIGFGLVVYVLYAGLNRLWSAPSPDSWWTLVGILGHGYIASSLLAASFVYYRQAMTWMEALLRWFREQSRSGVPSA